MVITNNDYDDDYHGTIGDGKGGENSGTGDIPSDPRLTFTIMVMMGMMMMMMMKMKSLPARVGILICPGQD